MAILRTKTPGQGGRSLSILGGSRKKVEGLQVPMQLKSIAQTQQTPFAGAPMPAEAVFDDDDLELVESTVNESQLPQVQKETERTYDQEMHNKLYLRQPTQARQRSTTSEDAPEERTRAENLEIQTRIALEGMQTSSSISQYGKQIDMRSQQLKKASDFVIKEQSTAWEYRRQDMRGYSLGIAKNKPTDREQRKLTTVDDVLPVFKLQSLRKYFLKIVRESKGAERRLRLQDFYQFHEVDISVQVDADGDTNEFVQRLDVETERLINAQSKHVVTQLHENDFVYVTFDTPQIREYLMSSQRQGLLMESQKKAARAQVYDTVDPAWNVYECLVCPYEQVNQGWFQTLSGEGFTLFYQGEEQTLVSIEQWERERRIYLKVRRIRFFRTFIVRKSFLLWRVNIMKNRRERASRQVVPKMLLANADFLRLIQRVHTLSGFEYNFQQHPIYTFIPLEDYCIFKLGLTKRVSSHSYRGYTDLPAQEESLPEFRASFLAEIARGSQHLAERSMAIGNELLLFFQMVVDKIKETRFYEDQRGTIRSSDEITYMSYLSTNYNEARIRSVARLADYIFCGNVLDLLLCTVRQLNETIFGTEDVEPQANLEAVRAAQAKQGTKKQVGYGYRFLLFKDFVSRLDYTQIAMNDSPTLSQEAAEFLFVKEQHRQISDEEDVLTRSLRGAEKVNPELLLDDSWRYRLEHFEHQLIGLPLGHIPGRFPPAPIFEMRIVLNANGVEPSPSESQFQQELLATLDKLVSMVGTLPKPHSVTGIRDILSKVIAQEKLDFFMNTHVSIQEMVSNYVEFQQLRTQFVQDTRLTYSYISAYAVGAVSLIGRALGRLLFAREDELSTKLEWVSQTASKYTGRQIRTQGISEVEFAAFQLQGLAQAPLETQVRFFEELIFFQLGLSFLPTEEDSTVLEPVEKHCSVILQERQLNDYPQQCLRLRLDQILRCTDAAQESVCMIKALDVQRSFMCFKVSTQGLCEELTGLLLNLVGFYKLTFILQLRAAIQLLSETACDFTKQFDAFQDTGNQLSEQDEKQLNADFFVIQGSIFDLSVLVGQSGVQQRNHQQISAEIEKLHAVAKEFLSAKQEKDAVDARARKIERLAQEQLKAGLGRNFSSMNMIQQARDALQEMLDEEDEEDEESELDEERVRAAERLQELRGLADKLDVMHSDGVETPIHVPSTQETLIEMILVNDVDYTDLHRAEQAIVQHNRAQGETVLFSGLFQKIAALVTQCQTHGTITSGTVLDLSLELRPLGALYGLGERVKYDEAQETLQNTLLKLDSSIKQFSVKRQTMYRYFQKSLLSIYIHTYNDAFSLACDVLCEHADIELQADAATCFAREIYLCGQLHRTVLLENLETPSDLYLYLLFQRELRMDIATTQLEKIEAQRTRLQDLRRRSIEFLDTAHLFGTRDYDLEDIGGKSMTEIDVLIEFMTYILDAHQKQWEATKQLATLIQEPLSESFALIDLESLDAKMAALQIEFQKAWEMLSGLHGAMGTLVGQLTFEGLECKTRVFPRCEIKGSRSLFDPSLNADGGVCVEPPELLDPAGSFDAVETVRLGTVSFHLIKMLYFIYKRCCKEYQLAVSQKRAARNLSQVRAFREALERRLQERLFSVPEPFPDYRGPEYALRIDVHAQEPPGIVRDLLEMFVRPRPFLGLGIQLLKQLRTDTKHLAPCRTIQLQPRHMWQIAALLTSPDLAFELLQWNTLITPPHQFATATIADLLAKDMDNPYRSLLGPQGDGIQELISFTQAVQSRKQALQKQLYDGTFVAVLTLSDTKRFLVETAHNLYGLPQGAFQMAKRQRTEELAKYKATSETYRGDSEIEYETDVDQIRTKQFQQNATLGQHITAVQLRLVEQHARRAKKHQATPGDFVPKFATLCVELDRFTLSWSRLIFRGYYSRGLRAQIKGIVDYAVQEYNLLSQLQQIKREIRDLKIPIQTHNFDDQTQLYMVGDVSELFSVSQDRVIRLQAVRTQCTRFKEDHIRTAIKQLDELELQITIGQGVLQSLVQYQEQFVHMYYALGMNTQISRALPKEAKIFSRIFKLFQMQMEQIVVRKQYFLQCCTAELQNLIQLQLTHDTEAVKVELDKYIVSRRMQFNRFFFLSDDQLCQFLCIQFTDQLMDFTKNIIDRTMSQIFDNVRATQLLGSTECQINALISREEEVLQFAQPIFITKTSVEGWSLLVQDGMHNNLVKQVKQQYEFGSIAFREMISLTTNSAQLNGPQLLQFIGCSNVQCALVAKSCIITHFLLKWKCFNNINDLFGCKFAQTSDFGVQSDFKQICTLLVDLLRQCIAHYVDALKANNLSRLQAQKYQILIQTDAELIELLSECLQHEDPSQVGPALVHVYNQTTDLVYLADLRSEYNKNNLLGTFGMDHLRHMEETLSRRAPYGYEFQGLQSRPVKTWELMGIMSQILDSSKDILLTGPASVGKTTGAIEAATYMGQFGKTVRCRSQLDTQFLTNAVIGAALEGSVLVLDDVGGLTLDALSIVSQYIQQLQNALRIKQYNVLLSGAAYNISSRYKIICTSRQPCLENYHLQACLRCIFVLQPNPATLYKILLLGMGFMTADTLSQKLMSLTNFLQAQSVTEISQLDVSPRRFRGLFHLIEAQWRQWVQRFSRVPQLKPMVGPLLSKRKKQEQLEFLGYAEELCVCYSAYRTFSAAIVTGEQMLLFNRIMLATFNPECVKEYAAQYLASVSYQTDVQKKIAKMNFALDSPRSNDLETNINDALNLFLLTKNIVSDSFIQLREDLQQLDYDIDNQTDKIVDYDDEKIQVDLQKAMPELKQTIQNQMQAQKAQVKANYRRSCTQNNCLIIQDQVEKYVQFEEALWIRRGVIILGERGSGKTSLWRNALHETNQFTVINPECQTLEEQFGFLRGQTYIDGIIPRVIRTYQNLEIKTDSSVSTSGLKYIVFDGKISPETAEYMNSVLDDSRCLQLKNGEQIPISNYLRFLFEAQSLADLPPSFVSRCAVVFVQQPKELWRAIVTARFRDMFQEDYSEFCACFQISFEDEEMVVRRIHTLEPSQVVVKKASQRRYPSIYDKIIRQSYPHGNDVYYNTAQLFFELFVTLQQRMGELKHYVHTNLFLSSLFTLLDTYLKNYDRQLEPSKTLVVRQLRSFILFSFVQTVNQFFDFRDYQSVFAQIGTKEYGELFAALHLEPYFNFHQCFYDGAQLIPVAYTDPNVKALQHPIITSVNNALSDYGIISVDYLSHRDEFAVQTVEIRNNMNSITRLIETRACPMFQIPPSCVGLLCSYAMQNGIHIISMNCKHTSKALFNHILLENYIIVGGGLQPRYRNTYLLLEHFEDAHNELYQLIKFIYQWQRIQLRQQDIERQYDLRSLRLIISANSASFCAQRLQAIPHNIVTLKTNCMGILMAWQATFNDHVHLDIFQAMRALVRYVLEVFVLLQKENIFSYDLGMRGLAVITQLQPDSFQRHIHDPMSQSCVIPYKRYLFNSINFVLRQEYLTKLGVSKSKQIAVLQKAAHQALASVLQELSPPKESKVPLYLHPQVLFKEDYFTLTPLVSPSPRYLSQIQTQIVDRSSPDLHEKPQRRYQLFYIEVAWPSEFLVPTVVDLSRKDFPAYPSVTQGELFQNTFSEKIEGINERFARLSYLLTTQRCLVTSAVYEQQSLLLYKQVSQRLSLRLIETEACLVDDTGFLTPRKALGRYLQQILAELLEEMQHGKVCSQRMLFVRRELTQDPEARALLIRLLNGERLSEELFTPDLIRTIQLQFDRHSDWALTDVQALGMSLLGQFLKVVISANKLEIAELQQKTAVEYEHPVEWSLLSAVQEGYTRFTFLPENQRHCVVYQQEQKTFAKVFERLIGQLSQGKPEIKRAYTTPMFYARFLERVFSFHAAAQQQLQLQSDQIASAMHQFEETSRVSQKISELIRIKNHNLKQQARKIQAIVDAQKTQKLYIETIKLQCAEDTAALKQRTTELEQEKRLVQRELMDLQPIVAEIQETLSQLNKADIMELGMIQQPSKEVQMVCQTVCLLLMEDQTQITWTQTKQFLTRGDLLTRLEKLHPVEICQKNVRALNKMITDADYNINHFAMQSRALSQLAVWARAYARYIEIVEKVEPRQQAVERLEEELRKKEALSNQKLLQMDTFKDQLELLKEQLQLNLKHSSQLNTEVSKLDEKLKKYETIVSLLQSQKQNWEDTMQLNSSRAQERLRNSILIACATFLQSNSYIQFDAALQVVADCLFEKQTVNLQNLLEIFADRAVLQNYAKHALTGDEYTQLSFLSLCNMQREILILDRDRQLITYLKKLCSSTKLTLLDQNSSSFDQVFRQNCMRAVTLVVFVEVNSIKEKVLRLHSSIKYDFDHHFNQQATPGRTITLDDGQVMSLHPHFSLLFVDQTTSHIDLELLGHFNYVSFSAHASVLRRQILSTIYETHQAQQADIYKKLTIDKAQFSLELVQSQQKVLNNLRGVNLHKEEDLDFILQHLETVSLKQAEIRKNLAETLKLQQKMDAQKALYEKEADALVDFYSSMHQYPLGAFVFYIRAFISKGVQHTIQMVLKSIPEITRKHIQLSYLLNVVQKSEPQKAVLFKMLSQLLGAQPDEFVLYEPRTETVTTHNFELSQENGPEDPAAIQELFVEQGDFPSDQELLLKRFRIGQLFYGLLRQRSISQPSETGETSDAFYQLSVSLVSTTQTSTNYFPDLQKAVSRALKLTWSQMLPLFNCRYTGDPTSALDSFVEKVRLFYSDLSQMGGELLAIVIGSHANNDLRPILLERFLSRHREKFEAVVETKRTSLSELLLTAPQAHLICKYIDPTKLVQTMIPSLSAALAKEIQVVTYYRGLLQLGPNCLLIVHNEVDSEELVRIQELQPFRCVFTCKEIPELKDVPKYYSYNQLDFSEQAELRQAKLQDGQHLPESIDIAKYSNDLVQFFTANRLEPCKPLETADLDTAYEKLAKRIIQDTASDMPVSIPATLEFIKYMLPSNAQRACFEREVLRSLRQGSILPYNMYRRFRIKQPTAQPFAIPKMTNCTPLAQFVLDELAYFKQCVQKEIPCGVVKASDVPRYLFSLLDYYEDHGTIHSINLSLLLRPRALLQALFLQAVELYGGQTSDYSLVYGHDGDGSDLFFEPIEVANGYFLNGELLLQHGHTDTISLKVAVQRYYKYRNLVLPLASSDVDRDAIQRKKQMEGAEQSRMQVKKLAAIAGVDDHSTSGRFKSQRTLAQNTSQLRISSVASDFREVQFERVLNQHIMVQQTVQRWTTQTELRVMRNGTEVFTIRAPAQEPQFMWLEI